MKELGIAAIIMGVFLIIGALSHKWLGEDNGLEEAAEAIFYDETGIDIDLSPESKERD